MLSARPAAQVGVKARVFEPELHPRSHGVGVSARDFLLLHVSEAATTAKAGVRTRASRPQPLAPAAPGPHGHRTGSQRTCPAGSDPFRIPRTGVSARLSPWASPRRTLDDPSRPRPHAQSVRKLGVRARAFGTPSAHAFKIGSHSTWIGSQGTWIGSQRTCLRPCGRCFVCPTLPPATRQRTTKPSSTITTPNQHVERKRRNQSQQGAKDDVAIPATPLERPRSRASQSAC